MDGDSGVERTVPIDRVVRRPLMKELGLVLYSIEAHKPSHCGLDIQVLSGSALYKFTRRAVFTTAHTQVLFTYHQP